MSTRTNIVIVRDGTIDIYHNRDFSSWLAEYLFWGPDRVPLCLRYCQPSDELYDEIWCEGVALIDYDNLRVLISGGDAELRFNVPLSRLFVELMTVQWPGWSVEWASIVDVADYIHYPRDKVLTEEVYSVKPEVLRRSWREEWRPVSDRVVATIRLEDRSLHCYHLRFPIHYYLALGPNEIRAVVGEMPGKETLDLPEDVYAFPESGFHVEFQDRIVDVWGMGVSVGELESLHTHWPGWDLKWRRDHFEIQAERTNDGVRFYRAPKSELERGVRAVICAPYPLRKFESSRKDP